MSNYYSQLSLTVPDFEKETILSAIEKAYPIRFFKFLAKEFIKSGKSLTIKYVYFYLSDPSETPHTLEINFSLNTDERKPNETNYNNIKQNYYQFLIEIYRLLGCPIQLSK